jgi:hypothetical protein
LLVVAVVEPEQAPRMVGVGGSKWAAEWGRCDRRSAGMLATSPEHAWRTLVSIGWRIFRPKDAQPYPECRSCAAAAHTIAKAVQHVKAAKKRATLTPPRII